MTASVMNMMDVLLVYLLPSVLCDLKYNFFQIVSTETTTKLGCFMDDTDREYPNYILRNDLTVEWCIRRCKSRGFRYAGVQSANECRCGNSFGKHGTATPQTCNMKCTGNARQTCGGHFRMEIYLIG